MLMNIGALQPLQRTNKEIHFSPALKVAQQANNGMRTQP